MTSEIELLLRRTMGLTAESVGSSVIQRAVRQRMATCDVQDVGAYHARLCAGHGKTNEELQELIELVVVPETSFFRHAEAFGALAELVTAPAHGLVSQRRTLRVLSAPCSTGEEAYSIAITLLENGVSRDRMRIDAVDISRRALARARHGVYGANSFRSRDLGFRDQYCRATPHGYAVVDAIREMVHFHHANLIGAELRLRDAQDQYDVIFCRNLLIYLDRPTQERLMDTLHQLLTPTGYLFVGPAEATLATECGFHAMGYPMAFAFRNAPFQLDAARRSRPAPPPQQKRPAAVAQLRAATTQAPPKPAATPGHGQEPHAAPTTPAIAKAAVPEAALAQARTLADAGRLDDAARVCETVLQRHGTSVEAHYLLALVRDALGETQQAAAEYRRVLFLAPGHQDAAAHLALLARAQGDAADAERLQARARRIGRRTR